VAVNGHGSRDSTMIQMPRTKIVCTLGPASDQPEVLRALIRGGMSVARINFSHGDHVAHTRRIGLVRQIAQGEHRVVALLGDLQGPRWRVGAIEGGNVTLAQGQPITLTTRPVPGSSQEVYLPHPELISLVLPGQALLLNDGLLEFVVEAVTKTDIRCRVVRGGTLSSRKGVNVPGVSLSLPAFTEKDRADLRFAVEQDLDYIALSFVRSAEDIRQLRAQLENLETSLPIVAKIEKREALDNIEDVIAETDAVMVARGDLGVEIPPEEVPRHQKRIIRLCNRAGKPVITATHMLDSMVNNSRPTRAEASDVANAILDGTDAVMLSAETASGRYPVEAVQMMARIATITEADLPSAQWLGIADGAGFGVTEAISRATVEIAEQIAARAIVTCTVSGYTARMIARHRPSRPTLAVTPLPATQRRLALVWGVEAALAPSTHTNDDMLAAAAPAVLKAGIGQPGDLIVITAGVPVARPGQTSSLSVHRIETPD